MAVFDPIEWLEELNQNSTSVSLDPVEIDVQALTPFIGPGATVLNADANVRLQEIENLLYSRLSTVVPSREGSWWERTSRFVTSKTFGLPTPIGIIGGSQIGTPDISSDEVKFIAAYIAASLPSNAQTREVVANLDLRPFIESAKRWGSTVDEDIDTSLGTISIDVLTFDDFSSAIDQEEAAWRAEVTAATGSDPGQRPSPSSAGMGPPAMKSDVVATGTPEQQQTAAESYYGTGVTSRTISEDDLREAFMQSGSTDILDALALQRQYEEAGMSVDMPTLQLTTPSSRVQGARPQLSAGEAVRYLQRSSISPQMLRQLQENLVSAGYFDNLDSGPVLGDQFDRNTNAAWRALLADSLRENKPIMEVLRVKKVQRARALPTMREASTTAYFNQAAQELIGRDLSATELQGLRDYLMGTRESTPMSQGGYDVTAGFAPQQVENYMRTEFAPQIEERRQTDIIGMIIGEQ
jgi:hypothetical protein